MAIQTIGCHRNNTEAQRPPTKSNGSIIEELGLQKNDIADFMQLY